MIRGKLVDPVVKALVNNNAIDKFEYNVMPFKRLMAYYKCAIMEVETKFKVLNQEFSLEYDRNPIETIKTRLKSTESIIKKLVRKNFPLTVDSIEANLNDIAGVRVVCSFLEDIYLLADCLLQQDDVKLIQVKDYIKNPKPNGYRSFHMIIEVPIYTSTGKQIAPVEIQIRTIAMDFWASLEHQLHYKSIGNATASSSLTGELKHCAETIASIDLKMQEMFNQINNL